MSHNSLNLDQTLGAVLFDWDGTLVDTGGILLDCWQMSTEEVLGYRFPVEESDRRRVLSMRAVDSFPTITSGPEQVAELTRVFDRTYAQLAPTHVQVHSGAGDLLRELKDRGIRTGVVTSKAPVRYEIDAQIAGLSALMDVVITGDDVAKGKPDPEGIHKALSQIAVTPSASVYVGDGPVDARAGKAAGLGTVLMSHGLHSRDEFQAVDPDLIVDDLHQLAAILRAIPV